MPLPVITDTYRCALHWTHTGGQTAINVIHVRRLAGTASAVATQIDTAAAAGMWGQIVNGATMTKLTVTPLDGTSASFELATSGAKWTGTAGAVDFIPQVAEVVTLKTGTRGRSTRGRVYLPFIGESAVSNGSITGAAATQTAWNTFLSTMNTASYPVVVASYKLAARFDVTSIVVQIIAGTQRRRQSRLRVS